MKSFLLTLMLLLGVTTASAQSYDYLILQKSNGGTVDLKVDGLKLTFENGNLVASNNGTTQATVSLAEMAKMYFSTDATGIENATAADKAEVTVVDGKLQVNAPEGTQVDIYAIDGRKVNANNLMKGTYVVRINNKSIKVFVK